MSNPTNLAPAQTQEENQKKKEKAPAEVGSGIVKSVLSGDRVVIYCDAKVKKPVWSPPEEKEIKLSGIKAPLPYAKWEKGERPEEPFAWDSRDYLRSLCIGKPVEYAIFKASKKKDDSQEEKKSSREFGNVCLKEAPEGEEETDLARLVIKNGWAVVPPPPSSISDNAKSNDRRPESVRILLDLEAEAKTLGLGLHSTDPKDLARATPSIARDFDEKEFYKTNKGKTLTGIVERVHNGSTLSVLLIPSFREILVKIAGVQCPSYRKNASGSREPFALEAKFTTERYLLQRNVDIEFTAFESGREQNNKRQKGGDSRASFYGEVTLNTKSIGELLLKSGLGSFVEWHSPKSKIPDYAAFQASAQGQRIRLWFSDHAIENARKSQTTSFRGKVKEIISGSSYVVLNTEVSPHRLETVTLSSVQVNRLSTQEKEYDGFFAYEAKEFARKKLLGKRVQVNVDYIKPAVSLNEINNNNNNKRSNGKGKGKSATDNGKEEEENNNNNTSSSQGKILPEKAFHTVLVDGKNIALALVELGYATVIDHRGGSDRSPHFVELSLAQDRAKQRGVGLHGSPEKFSKHRTNDVSRSAQKAKALSNSLINKNNGRHQGVVEYVFSGSRVKLCINPDGINGDSLLLLFSIDGIRCESLPNAKQAKEGKKAAPFALEAREYLRELVFQRDVDVQLLNQDKFGAFRGHMFLKKKNIALSLITKGYAKVNRPRQEFEDEYYNAEQQVKDKRLNIWKDYDPVKEEEERQKHAKENINTNKNNNVQASSQPRKDLMIVTEVLDGATCYVQVVNEEQKKLEVLMKQINEVGLDSDTPYTPTKDDVVLAKFSGDNKWYRAKVIGNDETTGFKLVYGDYGNAETVDASRIRRMRPEFSPQVLKWQAQEARLAYIQPRPLDQEYGEDAALLFKDLVWGKTMMATVEYMDSQYIYLSFIPMDNKDIFVNGELVRAGLAKVQKRLPRGANKEIVKWLKREQDDAFRNHRAIWEYGDDGEDDDYEDLREFGRAGRPKVVGA